MKKTYATSMPNHIGAFLKASKCFATLGIIITRVSYDKSVDSHMLFLDVEGTEEQILKADEELEKIGYLQNKSSDSSIVLIEFTLRDVPGSVTDVLELIIFDRTVENNGILDMVKSEKKGMIIFSPLAQGLLTDRYLKGIPNDSRVRTDGRFLNEKSLSADKLEKIEKLNQIAQNRGQTLAQMALAWLYNREEITSVLIGASKPEQIVENIAMIENMSFTDEELKQIDSIAL